MVRIIVYRILTAIPVLLVVMFITFFLIHLAPGGPFDAERAVPEQVLVNLNKYYKLDQPLLAQFWHYLTGVLQGDFGPSFKYPGRSVTDMILAGLPASLELAFYGLGVALVVGLCAGLMAGVFANRWLDYLPMSMAMIGICLPSFVLGPLLILIFGLQLQWLPVSGWGDSLGDKILPAITLGLGYAAYIARLTRGGIIEALAQDYIRTAKAKGASPLRILCVHALPGAMAPVIAFAGPAVAGLLSGSFVVETLFQIPGLGRYYLQGAFNRDYTLVLGMTILFSFLIISCNLLADIALIALNPRARKGS